MSKIKTSVSIDEDLLQKLQEKVDEGIFRSKSHGLEYAFKKYLSEKKAEQEAW